jgi:predicted nucleotidyltransferase
MNAKVDLARSITANCFGVMRQADNGSKLSNLATRRAPVPPRAHARGEWGRHLGRGLHGGLPRYNAMWSNIVATWPKGKGRALELSQISRLIHEWAQATAEVQAVYLFGSRAKGTARPDSDLDLAISASEANYLCCANDWEKQLTEAIGLRVVINQYNANTPKGEKIRRYCTDSGIQIFSR